MREKVAIIARNSIQFLNYVKEMKDKEDKEYIYVALPEHIVGITISEVRSIIAPTFDQLKNYNHLMDCARANIVGGKRYGSKKC